MRWAPLVLGGELAALMACATTPAATVLPPGLVAPFDGYASPIYSADGRWLCRPDWPTDPCRGDLTATELYPDGTRTVVPHVPAVAPAVDCFYVYPTVDLRLGAGNHVDFTDLAPMTAAALAQAARFTEACALYVPLYRQATLGTYLRGADARERGLAVAYSDVADAFLHYMGRFNHGRKVVLIGHSQGAHMITRLLKDYFDGDPAMRARLLLALPIGGAVEVAAGAATGGSFANIPLCTRAGETGCVVAYRSYRDGEEPATRKRDVAHPGAELACVNPAAPGSDERRPFSRTYFPTGRGGLSGLEGVTTPFVLLRDFYAGRCTASAEGFRYLAVEAAPAPGDLRKSPVDLDGWRASTSMGLHVLDMSFPQGDLVDLVARAGKDPAAAP